MRTFVLAVFLFVVAFLSTEPPFDSHAATVEQAATTASSGSVGANDQWETWKAEATIFSAIIALLAAVSSAAFFWFNRRLSQYIADRTVVIESHKLLLEINKQFVSDPRLLAIYDNHPDREAHLNKDPGLLEKIRALGYQKLNVFEIVFAAWPDDRPYGSWIAYFEDTLDKCSVVRDELNENTKLYDARLLAEYEKWKTKRATQETVGPPS